MPAQSIEPSAVLAAMGGFPDPETGRSAVETGQISSVTAAGDAISLSLALSSHSAILRDETKANLVKLLSERIPDAKRIEVNLTEFSRPAPKIGQIGLAA